MSLKQLELIFGKSFESTKAILLPFSFKRWVILTFVAIMAGAMGSFSSGNFQFPSSPSGNSNTSGSSSSSMSCSSWFDLSCFGDFGVLVPLILAIFFFLPLWLVFTWLSSRFAFIFYHVAFGGITRSEESLSLFRPWNLYKPQGNSLAKFRISFGLLLLAAGIIFGIMGYSAFCYFGALSLFILIPLFLLIILLVLMMFQYIDQFVVPIMAQDGTLFLPSFRKFWSLFLSFKKPFLIFILVAVLLSMFCGVVVGLLILAIVIIMLILGSIIFGGAYMLFGSGTLFILTCVILGIPFVLILIFSFLLSMMPVAYFYRVFTLYYFSEVYPEYVLTKNSETPVL